jgi:hypothetical protein
VASISCFNCVVGCPILATLSFDEPNTDGRLDGSLIEACHRDRCASGRLEAPDGGNTYTLLLTNTNDAGTVIVYATVAPSPTMQGSLRFSVQWSLAPSGPDGPATGDVFTVSAHASAGGAELFSHDFAATYQDVTVCGTQCKQFTTGP